LGVRRCRLPDRRDPAADLPPDSDSGTDVQRQRDMEAPLQGGRYLRPRRPCSVSQH